METLQVQLIGDQKELIIRQGEALPVLQNIKINIEGNIESPAKFHAIRPGESGKSLVVFSRSGRRICFDADPENPLAPFIGGELLLNPDLVKFGINATKTWPLQDLARFLKMNKTFFKDKDAAAVIVSSLMAFKGTITTDIEKSNDTRGNSKNLTDRKTDSNVPLDFVLTMPVFVGFQPKTFRVEIGIDSTDSSVKFWLESPELHDIIISDGNRIIDEEIKKFNGLIIIEQQ